MKPRDLNLTRLSDSLQQAVTEGWTPERLVRSVAAGSVIGIFPIWGLSTPMALVTIAIGKLNPVVLLGTAYILTPLKVMLILPCVRVGEWLVPTGTRFSLSLTRLREEFLAAPWSTLESFGISFLHAILGWTVFILPVLLLGYTLAQRVVPQPSPRHSIPLESL